MKTQPDLEKKSGCIAFVTDHVLPQVAKQFALHERCPPFGYVFALVANGQPLPRATAVAVGAPGISTRDMRRVMEQAVERTGSLGSVFIRQDTYRMRAKDDEISAIVVQVEHRQFSDLTWTAYLTRSRRPQLEPWVGPVEVGVAPVEINELRFLPNRWMS